MITENVQYLDYDELRRWLIETFDLIGKGIVDREHDISMTPEDNGFYLRGESKWIMRMSPADEPNDDFGLTTDINSLMKHATNDRFFKVILPLYLVVHFAYMHGALPNDYVWIYQEW